MRFLLDENVRAELDGFLRARGCDVRRLPKGAPDRAVAAASRAEERLIVTNDEDFASFPAGTVFGVVLLRLPQHDIQGLLATFQRLLEGAKDWKGHVIVLGPERWRSSPLAPKRGRTRRDG
jgi:predicted nuclease of predicted toxin-antitoxin system